jgi:hypothetical protein
MAEQCFKCLLEGHASVASLSRHSSAAYYHTFELLAVLKEITLELRALFGLSFPETT